MNIIGTYQSMKMAHITRQKQKECYVSPTEVNGVFLNFTSLSVFQGGHYSFYIVASLKCPVTHARRYSTLTRPWIKTRSPAYVISKTYVSLSILEFTSFSSYFRTVYVRNREPILQCCFTEVSWPHTWQDTQHGQIILTPSLSVQALLLILNT